MIAITMLLLVWLAAWKAAELKEKENGENRKVSDFVCQ
jgi:hypothetical protein